MPILRVGRGQVCTRLDSLKDRFCYRQDLHPCSGIRHYLFLVVVCILIVIHYDLHPIHHGLIARLADGGTAPSADAVDGLHARRLPRVVELGRAGHVD